MADEKKSIAIRVEPDFHQKLKLYAVNQVKLFRICKRDIRKKIKRKRKYS